MFQSRIGRLAVVGFLVSATSGCCITCNCSDGSHDSFKVAPGFAYISCGFHCAGKGADYAGAYYTPDACNGTPTATIAPIPDPDTAE